MEELAKKFEDLADKIPDYESDICDAINCIERATFTGVDKGKIQLEIAKNRLKEIDDLIASTILVENLPDDVNDRLMQCFISFRPRLESNIQQLKDLIENPPKESIFPPIDDSEIFPKENENIVKEEEMNDNNNNLIDQNANDNTKNEITINSSMDLAIQNTENTINKEYESTVETNSPQQNQTAPELPENPRNEENEPNT